MSSLKRTQMLQPRNLISSIGGGVQSAALDDEGSWLTRFKVLAANQYLAAISESAVILDAIIAGRSCISCQLAVAVGTTIADRPPRGSARALISACGSYRR
jgi:hypothetical protein